MSYATRSILVLAGVWSSLLLGACGGASTTPGGGTDAGPEPSDGTTGADTSVTTAEGGSTQDASMASDATQPDALPIICQLDASILTQQLEAEAGAGDSGIADCFSCIQSSCKSQVETCVGDCACKVNIENLVVCVADAGTSATCLTGLIGTGDPATSGIVGCLLTSSCPTICGITL
jgi:hypothetical protein